MGQAGFGLHRFRAVH